MTESEKTIFKLQTRYEHVCTLLHWPAEARQIGRVLLDCDPGEGLSHHAIADASGLPRTTVRRRVRRMEARKAIRRYYGKIVMTDVGRVTHISLHREIWRIAGGQQVGISSGLIAALQNFPASGLMKLPELAEIQFPADLSQNANLKFWL